MGNGWRIYNMCAYVRNFIQLEVESRNPKTMA